MTDTLKQNFEEFRYGPAKELLDIAESTFKEFNVDFYLIGAVSRDLWIEGADLRERARATSDIDFAIYANAIGTYEAILDGLKLKDFEKTNKIYRLKFNSQFVDIIPFGGVEQDSKVKLPDNPPWTISVLSYREALDHSISVDDKFNLVTLHGLCIMKLIAYYERPAERQRDLDDFIFLLNNYYNIFSERVVEQFPELFADVPDESVVGAIVLGKDMKEILSPGDKLHSKVLETLRILLDGHSEDEVNELYAGE